MQAVLHDKHLHAATSLPKPSSAGGDHQTYARIMLLTTATSRVGAVQGSSQVHALSWCCAKLFSSTCAELVPACTQALSCKALHQFAHLHLHPHLQQVFFAAMEAVSMLRDILRLCPST
eukprot:m.6158 g.6158  ORF g.6158 m.6158 type:complete len:119 (+) comp8273_c0_seq1:679-1035(+)